MAQIKPKFMTLALNYFKILFITITIMLKFYKKWLNESSHGYIIITSTK